MAVYVVGSQQGQEIRHADDGDGPGPFARVPRLRRRGYDERAERRAAAEAHGSGRGGTFAVDTYSASGAAVTLAAGQVAPVTSGGAPHNNLQPYLTMNWCIALQGVFPARS